MLTLLLAAQAVAAAILVHRLLPGLRRAPPVAPRPEGLDGATVTVIVPTLNEAARLEPCLRGLSRQGDPLLEVLVVDSGSTDGTRELVTSAMRRDSRIRLLEEPPLPAGWIGKAWALQHGLSQARGEWILGVDADTEPADGMVAGVVAAAREGALDLASFAPCFAGQATGERWLQPALLVTLVYRHGAPGPGAGADRLLANGQCFLVRREVLMAHGGYAPARASFADDVTLARHLARAGVRAAFLDGRRLYRVRSYRSAGEMWREWGRSVDLSDATGPARQWADLLFLALVQGTPVLLIGAAALPGIVVPPALLALDGFLLALRLLIHGELAPSYESRGLAWWLSWLADPLAVYRVFLSMVRRPVAWRGRQYRELG